jgi:RimJ/RimL family protein N-acetyltransferase
VARSRPIETPRLVIEPFGEPYLTDGYVGWLNDPEVLRYSDQRFRAHTRETCLSYLRSFEGTPNYFWAIRAKTFPDGLLGTATAYVDVHHHVADVGLLIGDKSDWGKGYGTELWLAVCDFLFRSATVRKVTGGTIEPNRGMLAIMERVGMVDDGRRQLHCLWEGRPVDLIHKALYRETWLERFPRGPFQDDGERL